MGYKQQLGPLRRAGYDKDATSPFPQKTDSTSGDKLPSYDVTTYDASASGGGSGQKTKTVSENVYTPPKRTPAGDAAYAALTPQQRKAQDAKYKKTATKTVTKEVPVSGGQETKEKLSTKTTTLGNQTLSQIQKGGSIAAQNRLNKARAVRQAARNQAVSDSTNVANAYLNKLPVSDQLSEKAQNVARLKGNWAAARALAKDKVYRGPEIKKMVRGGQNYLGQE